jgi:hypothetical protein
MNVYQILRLSLHEFTYFFLQGELEEDGQKINIFVGAPTSITRKLDFGDQDIEAKLRQECHIPEEVEFDLVSYYLYKLAFTFSLDHIYGFNELEEYCRNVGRSKSAINPVFAVMYGLLHKDSYLRIVLGEMRWRTILEVAVDKCTFCVDNRC